METRVLSNLNILGALVMSKDETDFPADPAIGTFVIKDQCLFGYLKIGGMETWYPFANKTNSYVHVQATDALTWTVTHNLGTSDVWIQVKDPGGNILTVGKTDIDENSFQLTFTEAVRGTVVVVAPDSIDVPGVKASFIDVANGSVHIDSSGIRVNGEYVLTSAVVNAAVEAEATLRSAADLDLQNQIDNLDASNVVSGVFNTARLGTGTANTSTYLRGDGTWQAVTGGATVSNITTDQNFYPTFTSLTTGAMTTVSVTSTKFLFNPSSGNLRSSQFVADNGLFVNSATISTSYVIPAGANAMSAGPISVADGVTVTIGNGSAWTVV